MENNNVSQIELLKRGNDIKTKYDVLKQEIIDHTIQIEEIEKLIDNKLKLLNNLEKEYVEIIEKIENA